MRKPKRLFLVQGTSKMRGEAETSFSQLTSGVAGDIDNVRFQKRDVDVSGPFLIVIPCHNATSRCPTPARSDPFCAVPDLTVLGMPSPLPQESVSEVMPPNIGEVFIGVRLP